MSIVIFEDEHYLNLLPLVYFRPLWDLLCGTEKLQQKLEKKLKNEALSYLYRSYLHPGFSGQYPEATLRENENYLFLNGRISPGENLQPLFNLQPGEGVLFHSQLVAFAATGGQISQFITDGVLNSAGGQNEVLKNVLEIPIKLIEYPWDLVQMNGEMINRDFENYFNSEKQKVAHAGLIAGEKMWIHPSVKIYPNSVINAENGAVIIEAESKIMPHAYIEGPVYIGEKSLIKAGAKIYENTSIGPVCKIGGEVEASIIQGYSNKQHEGFLGHAFIGEWVNIGADTNNSDLRNDYGNIKVSLNGYPVDSGSMFAGLLMGDHAKTAINTMFNTGSVVGACCNVYGQGFPPKFLPSFTVGGSERIRAYPPEKVKEVAARVMQRRNIDLTPEKAGLFNSVYKIAQKIENRIRVH